MGVSAFDSYASAPAPAATRGPIPDLEDGNGRYRVRFARDAADLEEVGRLRFRVFNLEEGEGLAESFDTGIDKDHFDEQCQHLMVFDREQDRVVGTYRLQVYSSAKSGNGFYSAEEYDLSTLPEQVVADSVELGRACIEREHRNRNVLYLLWRGLASYVLWHRTRYFFGCNSLPTMDPLEGLRMEHWLRENGHVHSELRVQPRAEFRCVAPEGFDPPSGRRRRCRRCSRSICATARGSAARRRSTGSSQTVDFFSVNDLAELDEKTFRNFADKR